MFLYWRVALLIHFISLCFDSLYETKLRDNINIISIVWRNWIRLKLISSSYLPIDRMYFPAVRENTIQHDGRLDWTCFISSVKLYLVSRKTFLLYSIITFHKVVFMFFFALQKIEVLYIFLFVLYNTMLLQDLFENTQTHIQV